MYLDGIQIVVISGDELRRGMSLRRGEKKGKVQMERKWEEEVRGGEKINTLTI